MYKPQLESLESTLESTLESLGGITPESLGASTPASVATGVSQNASQNVSVNSKLARGSSSSIEDRALTLLGSGVSAESVALALGVTPGRISQLMAEEEFASQVSTLRYENLQQHNRRDDQYDTIEDKLLDKLENSLPLLIKPQDVVRAMTAVNNAKRRGQSAPDQVVNTQNIVNLVLPQTIADQFSVAVDIDNKVTRAGQQELHTMPSSNLLAKVEQNRAALVAESERINDIVLDVEGSYD